MLINVRYAGGFNPELDKEIEEIVGSESVSSGLWVPTSERDIQFDVPAKDMDAICLRLRAHGVTAERRKFIAPA